MSTHRRTALIAGALYLLTIATSIPALALKSPILAGTISAATLTGARLAMILELILAVACVGTAVVLHPVIRRHSEALSLGFVAARTIEAATIVLGMVAVLALVTCGATGATEPMLVALHNWAFLLGPGLIPAVNALCLGTALFRTRLVPRIIPAVGLIGAPLLLASSLGTIGGGLDQVSPVAGALALPIAAWELTLGLWLTFKGFQPEAIERLSRTTATSAAG